MLVMALMLTNCLFLSSPVLAEDEPASTPTETENPTEPSVTDSEAPQETPQDPADPQETSQDPVDPQETPQDPTEPQETPQDPTDPQETPAEPDAAVTTLTLNLTLVNLDGAGGREALAPITVANDITIEALMTLLFSEGMPTAEDGSVLAYWTIENSGQSLDPAALLSSYLTASEVDAQQASLVLVANWETSETEPAGYRLVLHYVDLDGNAQTFETTAAASATPADVIAEKFGDSDLFTEFDTPTAHYSFRHFALQENGEEPYPIAEAVDPATEELVLYAVYEAEALRPADADSDVPSGPPVTAPVDPASLLTAGTQTMALMRAANTRPDGWDIVGGDHPTQPGEVKTYKEARYLEDEDLVNTYEVKLRVEAMNLKVPADVVLILDTSASMRGNKLAAAQSAGINLANRLIPDLSSNHRVGLVTFGSDVTAAYNLTNDKSTITGAIDNATASGGTFTQAAILKAKELLDKKGRAEAKKFIILLSDGEPTYCYEPEGTTVGARQLTYINPGIYMSGGLEGKEFVERRWVVENSIYEPNYKTNRAGWGSHMYHLYGYAMYNGKRYRNVINCGNAAVNAAGRAKDSDYRLFGIAFEAPALGSKYLEMMASPGSYYTADVASLNTVFNEIVGTILNTVKNAGVVDPMGQGFVIPSAANIVSYTPSAPAPTVSADGKQLNWSFDTMAPVPGVADVSYAEIVYRIEISEEILNATAVDGKNYLTNGNAVFNYQDSEGVDHSLPFPQPKLNPVLYIVKKTVQDKDGNDITSTVARTFDIVIQGQGDTAYSADYAIRTDQYNSSRLITTLRSIESYTIQEVGESANQLDDYDVTYIVNGEVQSTPEAPGPATFDIVSNQQDDVYIEVINREKPAELTITKTVNPLPDQPIPDDVFELRLERVTATGGVEPVGDLDGDGTDDSAFTLKHGEYKKFTNLSLGTYRVTEEVNGTLYSTEMQIDNGVPKSGTTIDVTLGLGERTKEVEVTNTSKEVFGLSAYKTWIEREGEVVAQHAPIYLQLYRRDPGDTTGATDVAVGQPHLVPEPAAGETTARVEWTQLDPETYDNDPNFKKLDESDVPYLWYVKEVDADGDDFTPEQYYKIEEGMHVYNHRIRQTTLDVKKLLLPENKNIADFDREFRFRLDKNVGTSQAPSWEDYLESTNIAGKAVFQGIDLPAKPGAENALEFKLYEVTSGDSALSYIRYDLTEYLIKLYTVQNANDPATPFTPVFEYYKIKDSAGKAITPPQEVETTEFFFENKYVAEKSWQPTFDKLVNKAAPEDGRTFTFVLKQGNTIVSEAESDADGHIVFPKITYTEEDAGRVFSYTVQEVPPEPQEEGMHYDTAVRRITVSVNDYNDGELDLLIVYPDGQTFRNIYLKDTEWQPQALKTMVGRELQGGEFSFQLIQTSPKVNGQSVVLQTVSNAADGTIRFEKIVYGEEDLGTIFEYDIQEVIPPEAERETGITFDKTVLHYRLQVRDDGKGIEILEKPKTAMFKNLYIASGSWQPNITKSLTGRDLKAGDFAFDLNLVIQTEDGAVRERLETQRNDAAGNVPFSTQYYNASHIGKIFVYEIREQKGSETGMTYDASTLTFRVKILDRKNGKLEAVLVDENGFALANPEALDRTFDNHYKASGTWTPQVQKYLNGKPATVNRFKFTLQQTDDGMVYQDTANQNPDGVVTFMPIKFTEQDIGETYHYTITEENVGEAGMTYDTKKIKVTLKITDGGNGKLNFQATYDPDPAVFKNTYKAKGEWTPYVLKNLNGQPAPEGRFSFKLWRDDASEDDAEIQANDADGKVTFETIKYDETDIGKVYVYHVKEVVPTPPETGMTYDDTKTLTFRVKIVDSMLGNLTPTLVDENDEPLENPESLNRTFNNTYEASGSYTPYAIKKVNGGQVTVDAEQFAFNLEQIGGSHKQNNVTNDANGKVTFDALTFTEQDIGKIFAYKITEVIPTNPDPNMTYDAQARYLRLKVSDGQNGTLKIETVDASGAVIVLKDADRTFNNLLQTDSTWAPEVTKQMNGKNPEKGRFSFLLTDVTQEGAHQNLQTVSSWGDGTIPFAPLEFDQNDVGKTFKYTIQEVVPGTPEDGMTYDPMTITVTLKVTYSNAEDTLVFNATYAYDNLPAGTAAPSTPQFNNTYKAAGTWTPYVLKNLNGEPAPEGRFSFKLWRDDESEDDAKIKSNDANGKVTFDTIAYDEKDIGKVYVYHVKEAVPATPETGMTYDTKTLTFRVKIVDKHNGKLEAVLVDEHNQPLEQPDNPDRRTFNNTYTATGSWAPELTKKLYKGAEGADELSLTKNQFKFRIMQTDPNTDYKEFVGNNADGSIKFKKLSFTEADIGKTYHYVITEVPGEDTGMQYDSITRELALTIEDAGNGKLTFTPVYTLQPASAGVDAETFVNRYTATGAWTPKVTKILTGRQLKEDEFSFTLMQTDDVPTPYSETVKNQADGTLPFQAILYTEADIGKTYTYQIQEVKPTTQEEDMTYDATVMTYTVKILAGENGELDVKVTPEEETTSVFKNTYEATGAWTPKVTKVLAGRALKAGEFSFTLKQTDNVQSPYSETAKNQADGKIQFAEITYTQADIGKTYTYQIQEAVPATPEKGMTYDATVMTYQVKITDAGNGKLSVAVTKPEKTTFTNTYKAEGEWTPQLTKQLKGRALKDKEFEFVLEKEDVQTQKTEEIARAQNQADGTIQFAAVKYTADDIGKTYRYQIKEVVPSEPEAGMTYDKTTLKYTVAISDAGNGKLTVDVTEPEKTTLTNTYKAEGEWTPQLMKTLTGRQLVADEFEFVLEEDDNSNQAEVRRGKNDAEGKISFEAIKYDENDIGKTYTYKIRELVPNAVGIGMTYDPAVLTYNVTIEDGGKGKLNVIVAGPKSGGFLNTYTTYTKTWTPEVTKSYTGGPKLADDMFEFVLLEGDNELQRVKNKADGSIPFKAITYTQADMGTHTYTIQEEVPQNPDRHITYDTKVRTVKVKVDFDSTQNALVVTADEISEPVFTNVYKADTVTWTPEATKQLAGKTLAAGDFTFELVKDDTVIERVENRADGKILFKSLSYTPEDAGDYTYIIREVKGSDPRVTYDAMTIDVKVKVTYDKTADKLAIEVTYPDDTTFNNTFKETETEVFWEPEVRKLLAGRELRDGEFSFVLESETGDIVRTASNNKHGRVRFTPLRFTAADVGKTYIYKVRELPYAANGRPDPTISYDDHILVFAVRVKETATHTLELAVSTQGDLEFRNTYTPTQPIVWHKELISDWHRPTASEPPAPTRTVIPATGEQRTLWPAALTLMLALVLLALRKRRP